MQRPQALQALLSSADTSPIRDAWDRPAEGTQHSEALPVPPLTPTRQISRFWVNGTSRTVTVRGVSNGGYACACSTQINYVSLLLDRLLRPVRAAARTRSRCLAQVRHPQDSGIL
jgi:hypothetical protein